MKILNKKQKKDMDIDKEYSKLFDLIILTEGGKNHYKEDRGGKTNFGLSEGFLNLIGIEKSPYELDIKEAKEIYYKHFYLQFKINLFKGKIQEFLFELCVNVKPKTYGTIIQRSCNLNSIGTPLKVDGVAGNLTRKKVIEICSSPSKEERLLKTMVMISGEHYTKEAEEDERQERFIIGWYNRVLKYLL